MKHQDSSIKEYFGRQKCPIHNETLVAVDCPVLWYCMFGHGSGFDSEKYYILQLGEHHNYHYEPPNVRPPNFISQGLHAAFLDSILNKGKSKASQMQHHCTL